MEFRLSFTFFDGKKGVSFIPELKCSIFFLDSHKVWIGFSEMIKIWRESFYFELIWKSCCRYCRYLPRAVRGIPLLVELAQYLYCILQYWDLDHQKLWSSDWIQCSVLAQPFHSAVISHLLQEPCLWWEERFADQAASGHEEGTSRILLQVGSLFLWGGVWDPWHVALVLSSLEQLRMLENKLWKGLALMCCGGSAGGEKSQPVIFCRINRSASTSEWVETDQETGFKLQLWSSTSLAPELTPPFFSFSGFGKQGQLKVFCEAPPPMQTRCSSSREGSWR